MRPRISRVAQLRCDSIAVSARGRTGEENGRGERERRKSGGFLLAEGKRRRLPKIYLVAPFSAATVGGGRKGGRMGDEDIKYPGIPGTYRAENYK